MPFGANGMGAHRIPGGVESRTTGLEGTRLHKQRAEDGAEAEPVAWPDP